LRGVGAPAVGREVVMTFEKSGISISAFLHLDVAQKKRGVRPLHVDVLSSGGWSESSRRPACSPPRSSKERRDVLRSCAQQRLR